jgi:hypothetical protein
MEYYSDEKLDLRRVILIYLNPGVKLHHADIGMLRHSNVTLNRS